MSSSELAAYTLTQKRPERRTTIIAPQNMHQIQLLMGDPPSVEGAPVEVVVVSVPEQECDEDQNRSASDKGGDVVMPMKRHQHSFCPLIRLIVPRSAELQKDGD